jgi:hypothetical protein
LFIIGSKWRKLLPGPSRNSLKSRSASLSIALIACKKKIFKERPVKTRQDLVDESIREENFLEKP